jgi:hypothetical protein
MKKSPTSFIAALFIIVFVLFAGSVKAQYTPVYVGDFTIRVTTGAGTYPTNFVLKPNVTVIVNLKMQIGLTYTLHESSHTVTTDANGEYILKLPCYRDMNPNTSQRFNNQYSMRGFIAGQNGGSGGGKRSRKYIGVWRDIGLGSRCGTGCGYRCCRISNWRSDRTANRELYGGSSG